MFQWNGEKYAFNILDADTMKKFNESETKMWKDINEYENEHAKNGKLTCEGLAEESKMMDQFFDSIFGEGISKQIFASEHDLSERVKALKKLYNLRNSQMEEHERNVNVLSELVKGNKK